MIELTTDSFVSIDEAPAAARDLRRDFRGLVHLPGEYRYDAHRVTWSKRIDPYPAMVAEATNAADVRAAVATAREHDIPFAVQGTGHGTLVPSDGGLLLKTARMSAVEIDPSCRLATVGPGTRWSEVIAAAARHGLAPLSGSHASVGVAGYTLGGGYSWLSRKYGFAADSLVSVDIVTADGELRTASASVNPDLFWAVRGAGGNFGVVTSLSFRLYPAATVYGGSAYFPIHDAAALLARYRNWATAAQPDELTTSMVLLGESPTGRPAVALHAVYAGDARDGERALRGLRLATGAPIAEDFRTMTYADTGAIPGAAPRAFEMFADLPDTVIEIAVDAIEAESANAIQVRHWGGAMAQTAGNGPVGHRDVPFAMTIDASDDVAADLARYSTGGSFLNFLHDPAMTHIAYTPSDYATLRELKTTYDPDNVFGISHNIPPQNFAR